MTPTTRQPDTKTNFQPIVIELIDAPSVELALSRLAHLPGCLLLDSAMRVSHPKTQPLGRYSFLMADPFEMLVEPTDSKQVFTRLKKLLTKYPTETINNLPPMQGGVAGLFTYDLNRSIEKTQPARHDEFKIPAVAIGAFDVVVAWDHENDQTWIISQGFPETEPDARTKHALSLIHI